MKDSRGRKEREGRRKREEGRGLYFGPKAIFIPPGPF
jgi:hypothetical protein